MIRLTRCVLLCGALVCPQAAAAQDGAGAQGGQTPPAAAGALTESLALDGVSLRYPATWSEMSPGYRNARTLVALPHGAQGQINARRQAYGLDEYLANVVITIEPRASHEDAVKRLKELSADYAAPADFFDLAGWPAMRQRAIVVRTVKGTEGAGWQTPAAGETYHPNRLLLRILTAVAVGDRVIRLDATLPSKGSAPLERDVEAMAASLTVGAAGENGGEADALRAWQAGRSVATVIPDASLPAETLASMPVSTPPGEITFNAEPGATTQVLQGASELEMIASTSGRYVVVATNGGYSYSGDAGRTWTAGASNLCNLSGAAFCNGDPSLAFARSGSFYYSIITWPTGTSTTDTAGTAANAVFRSTTNGQTYTFAGNSTVCNNGGSGSCFPDQEHIAADRNFSGTGAGTDQVYSVYRNFAPGESPALVCSQDNGVNWTAPIIVEAGGAVARIAVGGDGFVYVIYRAGSNIRLAKYRSCRDGLTVMPGWPLTVTGVTDVTCPVSGLDRCNNGNILSSHTVAPSDTNPAQIFVSYATNTSAGVNENVMVLASTDGGATFPNAAQVNTPGSARRYMPWVCATGGTAYVTWYDRRFSSFGQNDVTDFFGGSAAFQAGSLTAGPEFRISQTSDNACAYGGPWPCAPRAQNDSESCSVQPQLAGVCQSNDGIATNDSNNGCDFSSGPACPAGEVCTTGGGCPTYGDYNGNTCANGRLFTTFVSQLPQPGFLDGGNFPDSYSESRLVCCVPQLQTPGALAFGTTCASTPVTRDLEICNQGKELLQVTGITSSSPLYTVTSPSPGFPVDITAGNCQTFQVTFTPTVSGPVPATLTISSNDPVYPTTSVTLTGTAGQPDVNVTGSGEFGNVCAGAAAEKPISVCNTGTCPLSVASLTIVQAGSDAACLDFAIVGNPFPAAVAPGACVPVTVKYTPMSLGNHNCRLRVQSSNDPDEGVVYIPLHGNTPAPQLTVGADQFFPPTVIQSVGSCQSSLPFTVTNTGTCPVVVSAIAIGGTDVSNYSFSGLPAPAPPITLEPGHQLGEGALKTVFRPDALDRDRLGTVTVSWLSDPIVGVTTPVVRNVCGEGVRTGARVLVRSGGVPVPTVESLKIQRLTANRNKPLVDTVDVAQSLPLQTWTPAADTSCQGFQYHREYGTIDRPLMLAPGSYTVTATIVVNKKRKSLTVAFDVGTCGFNPVIVDF